MEDSTKNTENSTSIVKDSTPSKESSTTGVQGVAPTKLGDDNGLQVPEPQTVINQETTEENPATTPKVIKPVAEPITVNPPKEVKIVAKDPKGMFDYSNCQTYVVKEGDTLLDIAQKYVVAIQQLRYFNHIDRLNWKLTPGKTLYIPNEPVHVPRGK